MSIIIKDIKRNANEIIRIEVSEFKGRDLINIRIWYQAIAGGDVVFKPTQKGVTLNIAEFEELKDGIEKLAHYIEDTKSGQNPDQPELGQEQPEDSKDDE